MPNWLADPVKCAVRLKNEEGSCVILAGRNEVLSRATRVYRTVEQEGTARERTVWASGNVKVTREGQDQRRNHGTANLRLTVTQPTGTNGSTAASTTPAMLPEEATLASDVLRAAAVNAGGSACGGETILELLWRELMVVIDRLMSDGQQSGDGKDPGRAEGIAYAIAIMQNPYRPSVDDVREQAMARWEEEDAAPPPPVPAQKKPRLSPAERRARRSQ